MLPTDVTVWTEGDAARAERNRPERVYERTRKPRMANAPDKTRSRLADVLIQRGTITPAQVAPPSTALAASG